jgi:hypothetical protein
MRLLFFLPVLSIALVSLAEEPGARRWNITAECQMVTLSQKLALPLVSELNDETKIEAAFARLQELIGKGDAQLVANIVAKARDGEKIISENVEELRYATQFNPPQVPEKAPENLEVLKAWPVVGITPTAFDTRHVGAVLELEVTVAGEAKAIHIAANPMHVRFLRWSKTDAGALADGKHLFVEQPIFHLVKSMSSLTVRNGQRVLLGVHKLPEPAETMELFLLKVSAAPAP